MGECVFESRDVTPSDSGGAAWYLTLRNSDRTFQNNFPNILNKADLLRSLFLLNIISSQKNENTIYIVQFI